VSANESDGGGRGLGGLSDSVRDWADRLQQRHTVLGFPYAVVKKYGDDEGGRHAALLTYYGFLSIFPLLLLVVVIVSTLLRGDAELRTQVIAAIVPAQFQQTVDTAVQNLPSSGLALVVAVVGLLFSGMGIVFSAYHTLNHVAAVPHRARLELVPRYLRIFATLLLLVLGVVGVGVVTVAISAVPYLGSFSVLAGFVATTLLLFLLLWGAVALLLPHRARLGIVWPAALSGALVVAVIIAFGALVLPRFISRAGAVYGSFATIVGLFSVIYIVSQVLVFSAEFAIVRRRRLWPRGLDPLSPTDADQRALTQLAREQERTKVSRVSASFETDDLEAT
jgi:uncharacterized BrkB/YihY/UPF0761 family membrane protein